MEKATIDYQRNIIARKILDYLRENSLSLSCGESFTGGLIADAFVSIKSASESFLGSLVCYCAKAKIEIANVSPAVANENFSVNEQCAKEFAYGAIEKFNSDFAISSTGFAEDEKDVYLCVASRSHCTVEKFNLKGTRNDIRRQAVEKALFMFERFLQI